MIIVVVFIAEVVALCAVTFLASQARQIILGKNVLYLILTIFIKFSSAPSV